MKNVIMLTYVVKSKTYQGEIDRQKFFDWMKDIAERFKGNNEISTRFVKLIPKMTKMEINKDINETQDVPFVLYEELNSNEQKILKIMRCHHIIWGFLDHYCDEVMK